jgi:phosphatidylglycerophosphatase A
VNAGEAVRFTAARERVVQKVVLFLATGAYTGYVPVAPGTVGTLLALPLLPGLAALRAASFAAFVAVYAVAFAGAVWVAGAAEPLFDRHDSNHIVIDEVVGFAAVSAVLDFSWLAALLAFFLFRLFDIVKPFPASWVDRHVGGGLGVVGDDVVAGILAGLVARILLWFV